VSEGGALLKLAFVILLHLLLARFALPGTQTNKNTQGEEDQTANTYHNLAQP
jgi:hypothetical protein